MDVICRLLSCIIQNQINIDTVDYGINFGGCWGYHFFIYLFISAGAME